MLTLKQIWQKIHHQIRCERDRCQSCGMPLFYDRNRRAGSGYCSFCHDGVRFTHEDLSLNQMQQHVDQLLRKRNASGLMRTYMRWRVRTLQRWR